MKGVRCPACGARPMWVDHASGWAKCADCDRTFRIDLLIELLPIVTTSAVSPLEPEWKKADSAQLPRPRTIEIRELGRRPPPLGSGYREAARDAGPVRELRIGSSVDWVRAFFGAVLFACGSLSLYLGVLLALAFLDVVAVLAALAVCGLGLVFVAGGVDTVRSARPNAPIIVVLRPNELEVDGDGGRIAIAPRALAMRPATLGGTENGTGPVAHVDVVATCPGADGDRVVARRLGTREARYVLTLLAEHLEMELHWDRRGLGRARPWFDLTARAKGAP